MNTSEKYALVLAGGGAKGAYQIGAWKAFRELGIEFCAVAGASVGALNATLVAQNDFETALDLWENISLDKIVNLPPDLILDGKIHIRKFKFLHLREINKSLLKYGGLDSTPLLNLINKYVKEDVIRKSGVDLGLVTFNTDRLKPVEKYFDDIPEGRLAEYLLASASFPTFKQTRIDGKKYTDGGIYDNIPFRMIKARGYRRIIIVDIAGPGVNRKPEIEGTETVYIKNSASDLGSVLNFDRKILSKLLRIGYLDTMKTFGRLDGIHYFYKKDDDFLNSLREKTGGGNLPKALLPKEMRMLRDPLPPYIECAARCVGLDMDKEYSLEELVEEIKNQYGKIRNNSETSYNRLSLSILKDMRKSLKQRYGDRDLLGYPPSEYHMVLKRMLEGKKLEAALGTLRILFPVLPAGQHFLDLLMSSDRLSV